MFGLRLRNTKHEANSSYGVWGGGGDPWNLSGTRQHSRCYVVHSESGKGFHAQFLSMF